MSAPTPQPDRPATAGASRPLVERVRDQVLLAHRALERRDGASRPRIRRRSRERLNPSAGPPTPLSREVRALRRVFGDLGVVYRQYRRRTGEPVSVAIRTAANAFKQEPSLIALVPVAGFLDDLELLDW
jgi:hypothetical protein